MEIIDYLNKQDWDTAIAECAKIIDKYEKNGAQSSEVYMHRGYARCFVPSKDENYQEAIEDLSKAVTLASADNLIECYVKRAYAYWISGRYDSAIADCKEAIKLVSPPPSNIAAKESNEAAAIAKNITPYTAFAHELLGNIYSALDNPLEALEQYKKALSVTPGSFGSPGLLDNYRKARERLNRSR
jgi:tetratricopeptide (TPR) repeat protein